MSCDNRTNSPRTGDKGTNSPNRLPRFLFLGSHHEECVGELTLDASTLKDVWGDEPVALALASMLKAVLEGRVSSKKPSDDIEDSPDRTNPDDEENPPDEAQEARLALVEVFECFTAGMIPQARPVHMLDIDSLLARQHELSEARRAVRTASKESSSEAKTTEGGDQDNVTAEEEMLSVLLNLVHSIRKKHKLPSPDTDGHGHDNHALTFGIVDTYLSPCDKNDFDKDWLLVCRETKKQQTSENGVYPIQSIYSFFLVLNSDDLMSTSQSPSSDSADGSDGVSDEPNEEGEDDESVSVTPESDESKGSPEKSGDASPSSKPSLFLSVKNHEENSWSVLAALHEDGSETATAAAEEGDPSHIPDVTVIVDPLRIIGEYIRYLQGENAPPRTEQRKRRRVHVHESTVERPSCKIRILTPFNDEEDEEKPSALSPASEHKDHVLQDKMFREQEELRNLLEQKLRELQQSLIEQASQEGSAQEESTTGTNNPSPPPPLANGSE